MADFVMSTVDEVILAPSATSETTDLISIDKEFAEDLKKIPDKLAFKIGEVAELLSVKTYVLRYWESEFSALKPQKAKNNQRVYLKKDVELALMIKKLLHKDRFSIEGARVALKKMKMKTKKTKIIQGALTELDSIKDDLRDMIFEIEKRQKNYLPQS